MGTMPSSAAELVQPDIESCASPAWNSVPSNWCNPRATFQASTEVQNNFAVFPERWSTELTATRLPPTAALCVLVGAVAAPVVGLGAT